VRPDQETRPLDFTRTTEKQLHPGRKRELLRRDPALAELMGAYRPTAVLIVLLVAGQFALAAVARELPWWGLLLLAYVPGAVLAHALYVMIHEATHNLVFRRVALNKAAGIVANLPTVLPSALPFRKYHLLHHAHMGVMDLDADLPSLREARLVGAGTIRKTLWLLLFPVAQAFRPSRMGTVRLWDGWTVANAVILVAADVAVVVFLGPAALIYLTVSTLFGLGLHPLGGRWLQEHFVTTPGQETYSYYGPANALALNVGYHNEHHDMANVPWVHLPKLTKSAPDLYDDLASYRSWTALVVRFLFDRNLSPFSRIVRAGPGPGPPPRDAEPADSLLPS
jgi:sphingolipid delta-4 desaturase